MAQRRETAAPPETYVEQSFVWPLTAAQARNAAKALHPPMLHLFQTTNLNAGRSGGCRRMMRQMLLAAFLVLAASPGFAQSGRPDVIAFVHANVVPMDRERVLLDHTVVVSRGRIVALGPSSSVPVPRGAFRIDATGKYLIPALCDMHVHLIGEAWNAMLPPEQRLAAKDQPQERYLLPYVANGVTTVMAMSATPEELEMRRRIEKGELVGPRLILAPMIDGPKQAWPPPISNWVANAEEASTAVRRFKADGYDAVKVYSFLTKEEYDAIVSTAKVVDMPVIGHVPMALSVEYVIGAGQKLIAHTEEVAKHAHGDYSPERVEYYANLLVKTGTWISPTLVTTSTILAVFDDYPGLLARPEAAYWQEPLEKGVWSFIGERLYQPIPAEARQGIRDAFWKFQVPLTKALHDKGGRLLAGTDSPFPGLVPGFALHRELKELVAVGFTPYEALRTSTTAPFEFLDESDRRGTIAMGQESDLVLVNGNPLADISAAGKISGVLMRGQWREGTLPAR